MVKSGACTITTALAAIAISSTQYLHGVNAFQPSSPVIHVPRHGSGTPRSTKQILFSGARRTSAASSKSTIRMAERRPATGAGIVNSNTANNNKRIASILLLLSKPLKKLRKTLTIALATFAFLLASTRVHPPQIAHASSSAAAIPTTATSSTSTLSLLKRLNPLRPKTADELIENYVRQRLFADDAYDPVESAYREVIADSSAAASKDGSSVGEGAYPALLAETAAAALGKKDVSSLISPRSGMGAGAGVASSSDGGAPQKDVITNTLIRTSTFLQRRLGLSESVSYYAVAAGALVGFCVVPAMLGVLYQGLQRMQIDRSEMKMYGKITDIDATAKKRSDDDDDDDEPV
mmetsp:Transcript_23099/g.46447  ORF Transcript_23099/g.46447 Transcript_23099/m.46447 type:complete len:350 (+) Transcript_23099:77-1126(+)